jgi:hypothetical protein
MNKENHQLSGSVSETRLRVEVLSDVICPWCFIGKRRLEKAVRSLNGRGRVEILWRPFELNPDMPREGMDRKAYRAAKFGSWERSQQMDARITETARHIAATGDYRRRLDGQWGIVDVDDVVAAARFLVERGDVDPRRLAVEGGSAGGYTTLAALAFRDVFLGQCPPIPRHILSQRQRAIV